MRKTGPRQLSWWPTALRGRKGSALGRIRAAKLSVAKSEAQENDRSDAGAADTSRLLEAAANDANLARALFSKGAWVKSNIGAMTRAHSPAWFAARMASLKALWHDLHPPQVSVQLMLDF